MATIDLRNMITPEKNFTYFSAFISSFMGRPSRICGKKYALYSAYPGTQNSAAFYEMN